MDAIPEMKLSNDGPAPWWTWIPLGLLLMLLLGEVTLLAVGPGDFEYGLLLFSLGVIVVPQALLAGGIGLRRMADYVPAKTRWIPVLVFAGIVGFELFVVGLGLEELVSPSDTWFPLAWVVVLVIAGAVALETWRRTRRMQRWWMLLHLSTLTLAVSLSALVLNIVFHQWTSSRGGFLAGIGTAIAIMLSVHGAAGSLVGFTLVGLTRNAYLRHNAERNLTPRCRVCDYDLRASPERCPECGTPRT